MLTLDHTSQLKPLNMPHIICTVGVFDGIHLGHQKIIKTVVQTARECGGTSVVVTFDRHPYNVINPSIHLPLLTSPGHKLMLIDSFGIDVCVMMRFNRAIADIPPETWIRDVLWDQMHIQTIYLGEDSAFGKDGKGDFQLLSKWGRQLGFKAVKMEMLRIEKEPVSSTIIRKFVISGEIISAQKFLGRPYSIFGIPVRGAGRGKELGFPTINLNTQDQCLPPNGVYAVLADHTPAIANLGIRPTFGVKTGNPILEAHLLENQDSPLTLPSPDPLTRVPRGEGKGEGALHNIEVTFIEKIRNEMRFAGTEELTIQIEEDITQAKKIFSAL